MTRILKKKSGSVFILVIISLTIVLILGTILTTASMVNYNMNNVDSDVKSTFYYAEAGHEQVHLLLSKQVKLAYKESQKKTIEDIKTEVIDATGKIKTDYIIDGNINNTKLQEFQQRKFDEHFKSYFQTEYTKVDGTDLVSYLENPANMQLLEGQSDKATVTVLKDEIKLFSDPVDRFIIPVEVQYEDKINKIKKTIRSEYEITIPSFTYSMLINKSPTAPAIKRGADEILRNVVTSNKIEIKNNAQLFIEQSYIYAKGSKSDPIESNAGVIIDGGTLDIKNGRTILVSKGGVYLKSDNSKLILAQGTAYSQRIESKPAITGSMVNNIDATIHDIVNLPDCADKPQILSDFDNYSKTLLKDGKTRFSIPDSEWEAVDPFNLYLNHIDTTTQTAIINELKSTMGVGKRDSGEPIFFYSTGNLIIKEDPSITGQFDSDWENNILRHKGNLQGIIISEGDVTIQGQLKDFFGSIVTKGTLLIDNNAFVKLTNADGTYDSLLVNLKSKCPITSDALFAKKEGGSVVTGGETGDLSIDITDLNNYYEDNISVTDNIIANKWKLTD